MRQIIRKALEVRDQDILVGDNLFLTGVSGPPSDEPNDYGAGKTALALDTVNLDLYAYVDHSGLAWHKISGGGGTPGGAANDIQFNDAGAFGGTGAGTTKMQWLRPEIVLTPDSSAAVGYRFNSSANALVGRIQYVEPQSRIEIGTENGIDLDFAVYGAFAARWNRDDADSAALLTWSDPAAAATWENRPAIIFDRGVPSTSDNQNNSYAFEYRATWHDGGSNTGTEKWQSWVTIDNQSAYRSSYRLDAYGTLSPDSDPAWHHVLQVSTRGEVTVLPGTDATHLDALGAVSYFELPVGWRDGSGVGFPGAGTERGRWFWDADTLHYGVHFNAAGNERLAYLSDITGGGGGNSWISIATEFLASACGFAAGEWGHQSDDFNGGVFAGSFGSPNVNVDWLNRSSDAAAAGIRILTAADTGTLARGGVLRVTNYGSTSYVGNVASVADFQDVSLNGGFYWKGIFNATPTVAGPDMIVGAGGLDLIVSYGINPTNVTVQANGTNTDTTVPFDLVSHEWYVWTVGNKVYVRCDGALVVNGATFTVPSSSLRGGFFYARGNGGSPVMYLDTDRFSAVYPSAM